MNNSATEQTAGIIPAIEEPTGVMMPIANIKDLAAAVQAFNEIKTKIILQDKNNYVETAVKGQKKIFLKRSAWRTIQLAYNISDRIVKEEELSDDVGNYGYKIWAEVYTPSKSVVGVALCWSNEPNKTFPHGRHDVYATAHTRAKNRAISDFVGSGEVSAEEMESVDHTPGQAQQHVQPTIQREEICSCGHAKFPHHFSDAKEVICQTCIKEHTEVAHSLKPWR